MTVPVTNDQAAQLQSLVVALLSDKSDADAKTAASNAAQTTLLGAQQAASDAAVAEATADGKVNADIQSLLSFVQGLTGVTVTPAAPVVSTGGSVLVASAT